jgi:hypothetical protein
MSISKLPPELRCKERESRQAKHAPRHEEAMHNARVQQALHWQEIRKQARRRTMKREVLEAAGWKLSPEAYK